MGDDGAEPRVGESRGVAMRRWARRSIVVLFTVALIAFAVRAYWAPHREFGYQMFPESSQWQAEIFAVTATERASIEDGWSEYRWNDLVDGRGLDRPWRRHHADSGLGRQLEFLQEALDWVARNTPADTQTIYFEAEVTTWPNLGEPERVELRSVERVLP